LSGCAHEASLQPTTFGATAPGPWLMRRGV
jgi:hypothetical protein